MTGYVPQVACLDLGLGAWCLVLFVGIQVCVFWYWQAQHGGHGRVYLLEHC